MKLTAEIVNGKCPTCSEITLLIGLTKELYRCMHCGADLEQHINDCDTLFRLMSENPKLIERPIVVKGQKAILGRPPENIHQLL